MKNLKVDLLVGVNRVIKNWDINVCLGKYSKCNSTDHSYWVKVVYGYSLILPIYVIGLFLAYIWQNDLYFLSCWDANGHYGWFSIFSIDELSVPFFSWMIITVNLWFHLLFPMQFGVLVDFILQSYHWNKGKQKEKALLLVKDFRRILFLFSKFVGNGLVIVILVSQFSIFRKEGDVNHAILLCLEEAPVWKYEKKSLFQIWRKYII